MPSKAMIVLTGHAGRGAEFKDVGSGLTTFSIAHGYREKGKSGEYEDHVNWYSIKVWGAYGQKLVGKILKGDNVQVIGDLKADPWTGKDGTEKTTQVVTADYFNVLCLTKHEQGPPAARVQGDDLPF